MVACTAADPSANTAIGSFNVRVKGGDEQLTDLLPRVTGLGWGTSLADKVRRARSYLRAGNTNRACDTLTVFIIEVRVRTLLGNRISPAQAREIIETAQRIRAVVGC